MEEDTTLEDKKTFHAHGFEELKIVKMSRMVHRNRKKKPLKITRKHKRSWFAKAILCKRNEAEGIPVPNFKLLQLLYLRNQQKLA